MFATAEDYAEYMDNLELIDDADLPRQLSHASDDIRSIMNDTYDDEDDDHVEAAKKATMAWVEALRLIAETGGLESYRLGDVSVKYSGSVDMPDRRALTAATRALRYLDDLNLRHRQVIAI